jgi:hypothetical chaperone protein
MAGLRVGVDFGTSNSAAALAGATPGDPAEVLEIDPEGEDRRLFRSVLFYPEQGQEAFAGGRAISRYLEEGEGRFLQSLKSFLPQTSFDRTSIRNRSYALEEIVAALLAKIRQAIERRGGAISRAVFGRPAVFSSDEGRDKLAEMRLRAAAELAGFPSPTFLIEPIAAALGYEARLDRDEVVLVGDFGAGTSDFTLMRLGPSRRHNADRREDVIASSGVRVGGDRFDAAIVEHRLLRHFGKDSTYLAFTNRMPLPAWMTRKLLAWHELSLLRAPENLEFLKRALSTSDEPQAIKNLIRLAEENLAYHLYRAVEAAKRALSDAEAAAVRFRVADLVIEEEITRREFEEWTAPLREELGAAVDRVLSRAGGVSPDAVFLTGGSSKIPAVRRMFAERFGEGRLREGDAFTSVVAGLGRAAA